MGKRVVRYTRTGKAIAVYDSIAAASKATGIDKNNILRNIEGYGNKYIFNTYFQWEVTNQELRAKKKEKDKEKLERKLEELKKEFHID